MKNPINAWMRRASRREILTVCPKGSALLEVGCGTGADAVFLADRGYRIVAFDISDRMVEKARLMANRHKREGTVTVLRGRLGEIAVGLEESSLYPFQGAYANFSLTYEESLRDVARLLHRLLRPGSPFVFTLPNKLCVSQPVLELARLRVRRMFGRWQEPLWGVIRGETVRVHAYTPREVARELEGWFSIENMVGVPVFMPPPSFYRASFAALLAGLERLDDRFGAAFPLRYFGDTTLFTATRTEA